MVGFKSIAAVVALSLVRDSVARIPSPPQCSNACAYAVNNAYDPVADCSSVLVITVTPADLTTTFTTTITSDYDHTSTHEHTASTDITATETSSSTESTSVTSTGTDTETTSTTTTFGETETTSVTQTFSETTLTSETETSSVTEFASVTATFSETETTSVTSTTTTEEIRTQTITLTETLFDTTTTTIPFPQPTLKKRKIKRYITIEQCQTGVFPTHTRPPYASGCNYAQYTDACSCIGVTTSTITVSPTQWTIVETTIVHSTSTASHATTVATETSTSTTTQVDLTTETHSFEETVYVTETVHFSETTTATETESFSVTETSTSTLSFTSTDITTSTASFSETSTITETSSFSETETISTTTTETSSTSTTSTATATSTLPPNPPNCYGTGLNFQVSSPNLPVSGQYLTSQNIAGEGIFWGLSASNPTALTLDANNNLIHFPVGDRQMVVRAGNPPYRISFRSASEGVSYSYTTQNISCQMGAGPNYRLGCHGVWAQIVHKITVCQDPQNSSEYFLWLYSSDSQLTGMTCFGEVQFRGVCVPPSGP